MDDLIIKLLEVLPDFAWPLLACYVVVSFRKEFSALMDSAKQRKFIVEIGGQKLTMEEANEQQQGLIQDLQEQIVLLRKEFERGSGVTAARLEDGKSSVPVTKELTSSAILWVDDQPKNNSHFIDFFLKRGYRVDLAESTSEGLVLAQRNNYGVIISDMGRREDGIYNADAGMDLFEQLKELGVDTPYVVYSSAKGVRMFQDRLLRMGGAGITSSPTVLRGILDRLIPGLGG